jgi:capsular exopolysaccharide synthesis family protein
MSKIEEALRLAKEQRAPRMYRTRRSPASYTNIIDAEAETPQPSARGSQRLAGESLDFKPPAIYQLEPANRYVLDDDILSKNRIINDDFPENALTSYKMLRTRIIQKMVANDWKVLGISSPHDGAGKTVTATNLAIATALHGGHEVYLLDLDLRRPGIASNLGLPIDALGLSDFLVDKASFSNVCCDIGVKNLVVCSESGRHSNSSELITSKPMFGLLAHILSASIDPIIILDLPAVLSADDVLAISPIVDGFLLVVSERETSRDDVPRALEALRDSNVMSVVLNKSHEM